MSDIIPPPPGGDTGAYRELVQAHDAYIRQLHELMEHDKPDGGIASWLPYACYAHILQLALAVQNLVAGGDADAIRRRLADAHSTLSGLAG